VILEKVLRFELLLKVHLQVYILEGKFTLDENGIVKYTEQVAGN
jgi:hypothetical protein